MQPVDSRLRPRGASRKPTPPDRTPHRKNPDGNRRRVPGRASATEDSGAAALRPGGKSQQPPTMGPGQDSIMNNAGHERGPGFQTPRASRCSRAGDELAPGSQASVASPTRMGNISRPQRNAREEEAAVGRESGPWGKVPLWGLPKRCRPPPTVPPSSPEANDSGGQARGRPVTCSSVKTSHFRNFSICPSKSARNESCSLSKDMSRSSLPPARSTERKNTPNRVQRSFARGREGAR